MGGPCHDASAATGVPIAQLVDGLFAACEQCVERRLHLQLRRLVQLGLHAVWPDDQHRATRQVAVLLRDDLVLARVDDGTAFPKTGELENEVPTVGARTAPSRTISTPVSPRGFTSCVFCTPADVNTLSTCAGSSSLRITSIGNVVMNPPRSRP
jgi:hypothetical protein